MRFSSNHLCVWEELEAGGGRAQVLGSCWHRCQQTGALGQPYPTVCLCRAHKQTMVSTFLNGWRKQKEYCTRHIKFMQHSNFDVHKESLLGEPLTHSPVVYDRCCCHTGQSRAFVTDTGPPAVPEIFTLALPGKAQRPVLWSVSHRSSGRQALNTRSITHWIAFQKIKQIK